MKNNIGIVLILLAVIAAICLIPTCNRQEILPPVNIDFQTKEDSLKNTNAKYQKEVNRYREENSRLKHELAVIEMQLKKGKEKGGKTQKQVHALVKSDWKGIPVKERLEKCDTLKQLVIQYEQEREITDSLTEIKIKTLEEFLEVKDRQIADCQLAYHDLKTILEGSINDNEVCSKHVDKLDKKLRRKQKINQVLGSGAAVIALLAATIVLASNR